MVPASRRVVELVLLFVVGPALLALGPRWLVTVGILVMGVLGAVVLLADPTFSRADLLGREGARQGMRPVLVRTLLLGALLVGGAAIVSPGTLLPRVHPLRWSLIMVLYPLSSYAQEIFCRTLFFHRYGELFRRPKVRVLASGLLFGWAHVSINNVHAIVLATLAGVVFASTYERWRSTLLVSIEHALYGDLAFTAGLGHLFYSHARWVTWGG